MMSCSQNNRFYGDRRRTENWVADPHDHRKAWNRAIILITWPLDRLLRLDFGFLLVYLNAYISLLAYYTS